MKNKKMQRFVCVVTFLQKNAKSCITKMKISVVYSKSKNLNHVRSPAMVPFSPSRCRAFLYGIKQKGVLQDGKANCKTTEIL